MTDEPPPPASRLDRLVESPARLAESLTRPLWREVNDGESRWPVAVAVATAIMLQVLLPRAFAIKPWWLTLVLEGSLMLGLAIANPRRINRVNAGLRATSLTLIAVLTATNAWSAGRLIRHLIAGDRVTPRALLGSGAAVWVTNVIAFAMWYWELDRGGPARRAQGTADTPPDFVYPQMTSPELSPAGWTPAFVDYLYVSFTNATAFSPTDVMPMSRWAKLMMMVQSAISLVVVGLVIARAVNVLS